jgi:hypothetical protein
VTEQSQNATDKAHEGIACDQIGCYILQIFCYVFVAVYLLGFFFHYEYGVSTVTRLHDVASRYFSTVSTRLICAELLFISQERQDSFIDTVIISKGSNYLKEEQKPLDSVYIPRVFQKN